MIQINYKLAICYKCQFYCHINMETIWLKWVTSAFVISLDITFTAITQNVINGVDLHVEIFYMRTKLIAIFSLAVLLIITLTANL